MPKNIITLFVCALILILSLPTNAQIPWPSKPQNLQVFPKDTKIEKLKNIMFAFSNALGVNCIHCHVAKDKSDFSTYDFASDENVNKKKARLMLKMVFSINNNSVKEIAALSDEKNPVPVNCTTCHRGYVKPMPLEDVLYKKIKAKDIQAGVDEYNRLRKLYYGKGTFNFDENALIKLGYKLMGEKAVQDALVIFKLNTEMNPVSANAFDSMGDAYVALGDYKSAVESAEKCIHLLDNVIKINDSFHSRIRKSALDKIEKYSVKHHK